MTIMAPLSEPKVNLQDPIITINKTEEYSLCDLACDPDENYTGNCPSACISVCPKYCQYPVPIPDPTISVDVNMNHHHKASSLLIAMLSLVGATLLVICLYVAYVKIKNSRRRRRQPRIIHTHEDNDDFFDSESQGAVVDHPIWYIRTLGLQPSVINSIMVFKYKRGDGLIEGSTECSVCLTEFEEDETLRLLPKCSHAFHVPCIDTWLGSHTNCPMCRAPIVVNSASRVQTVEQDSGNSNPTGEEGIGDGSSEESDMESGGQELRMGIVGDEELGTEDERKRNEVEEIQPVRRSVSLDSLAASKISLAFSNVRPVQSGKNSDPRIEKFNRKSLGVYLKRVGSSSGRSLQNRPSFIRSLSLSGQRLQSVYSRSQSSVLPL